MLSDAIAKDEVKYQVSLEEEVLGLSTVFADQEGGEELKVFVQS